MTASILIDTHILIWLRTAADRLRAEERRVMDTAARRLVSVVSLWEIAMLASLGRISDDPHLFEAPRGFDLLSVESGHCRAMAALPRRHGDPFDRMLIAQAKSEGLALLTRDLAFAPYAAEGVNILGAAG